MDESIASSVCMMGVFEEIRTYPVRFLKSCGLFSCFLCMGLSMGIVGPTLLDFKVKTQSPLSLAALIFPVRAGGYAFGTFVSGMFYHKMDVQKLITVTMTISGVITLAIPFISDIKLLLLAFAIVGLSLGLYSSGKTYLLAYSLTCLLVNEYFFSSFSSPL